MIKKNKKAQEEMLGFGLIIIMVLVILMVFLGFSLRNPEKQGVESYEVESFIQAMLQYHTDCSENYVYNYFTIQDLIFSCDREEKCLDERDSCQVLESTLKNIARENWQIQGDRPVKGYEINITSNREEIISFIQGNATSNYKSSSQTFRKSGSRIEIFFTAYYE